MMKKILFISLLNLTCFFSISAQCPMGTTQVIFEDALSIPSGWTVDDFRTNYWLVTDDAGSGTTGEIVQTSNIDVSAFNEITVNIDVATFGSGTNHPAKIEFSTNGGTSFDANTFTTATPTSSSPYIDGGDFTFSVPLGITNLVIRISKEGSAGRDVRIRNFYLCGSNNTCDLLSTINSPVCESENAGPSNDTYSVSIDFTGGGTDTYTIIPNSGVVSGDDPNSMASGTINITGITEGVDLNFNITSTGGCDIPVMVSSPSCEPVIDAILNEIHYDNDGTDVNEFVEVFIAGVAQPGDLSLYEVSLYNGSNGTVYDSETLDNMTQTCATEGCYYVWTPSSIQNGAPDGFALSYPGNVEFLSYEGTFSATSGPASRIGNFRMTSVDIGVQETGSTPVGTSIQRQSSGLWFAELDDTPGSENDATVPVIYSSINLFHKDNSNILSWSTASEVNNDYFDIEHSLDGENFNAIGRVGAKGSSRAAGDYSFTHEDLIQGMHYYRLKQVDLDGTYAHSEVKNIEVIREGEVTIFPSMVQDQITIRHNFIDPAQVRVYNMSGQEMIKYDKVDTETSLDVSTLTPNVYIVNVASGTQQVIKKIVKQ